MPADRATMPGGAPAASGAGLDWGALRNASERALIDPVGARAAYNAVASAGYCQQCWVASYYAVRTRLSGGECPDCGSKPRRYTIIGGQWMLSVADMARLLLVSPRRVRRLIADGRIPQAVRVGHGWYAPADSGWEHIERRLPVNPNWRKRPEEGGAPNGVRAGE